MPGVAAANHLAAQAEEGQGPRCDGCLTAPLRAGRHDEPALHLGHLLANLLCRKTAHLPEVGDHGGPGLIEPRGPVLIHAALHAGINVVDTADVYAEGESEVIVGKALTGGRRDDIILATKVHGRLGDDVNQFGNSRRWITREVEDSLRRLQTDWIDLYQVHRPEPDTDLDETLGALSDLVGSRPPLPTRASDAAARRGPDHPLTANPLTKESTRGTHPHRLRIAERRLAIRPAARARG